MAFEKKLKGIYVLASCFIYIIFSVYFFNFGHYQQVKKFNQNADLPEERFGYTADEFYKFLENIGLQGKFAYHNFLLVDFVNAALLATTLVLLIWYLLSYLNAPKFLKFLVALPIFLGVLDIAENSFLLYILTSHHEKLNSLVSIASSLTTAKLIVGSLSMLLLLILSLGAIIQFIRRRLGKNEG